MRYLAAAARRSRVVEDDARTLGSVGARRDLWHTCLSKYIVLDEGVLGRGERGCCFTLLSLIASIAYDSDC